MDKITERLKASVEKQNSIDRALSNLSEAVKQSVSDHKTWLDAELRRSHNIISQLQGEKDILIEQLLKLKRILAKVKEDLN